MASNNNKLMEKWASLSPRNRSVIAVGTISILLMGTAFIFSGGNAAIPAQKQAESDVNFVTPSTHKVMENELAAQVATLQSRVSDVQGLLEVERNKNNELSKQVSTIQNTKTQDSSNASTTQMINSMATQIQELQNQIGNRGIASSGSGAGSTPNLADSLPTSGGQDGGGAASNGAGGDNASGNDNVEKNKLVIVGDNPQNDKAAEKKKEKKPEYLAAGSMFDGVLLNGMDAPTSSIAMRNPVPALIRIKTTATMANLFHANVRECFVLVSGYGVLASERAQLRTESLTCIKEDGKAVETKLYGYVVGEDGKAGMRGRLVSKQGSMIAKSLLAGFASGIGQAFSPMMVPQLNTMPGSNMQYQMPSLSEGMQAGVMGGISQAANNVSAFYLKMASEMFPVVEVDAGRRVTIITIAGIDLN